MIKSSKAISYGLLAVSALATVCAANAENSHRLFGAPEKGKFRPPLWVRGDKLARPSSFNNNTTSPYTPQQVFAAYGFNVLQTEGITGAGQTIAIVDAYDDGANIQNDLNTFDSEFGLPATTVQVIYAGGTKPAANAGWQQEISLDVEWAHAIAPGAKILLVEAASSSTSSLLQAVQAAVNAGATVVSMSWGGSEFAGETSYDSYFTAKGVTFIASAGDSGAGVEWPAASPNVIGVGGTSLILNSAGGYASETAWTSGGGGISAYETTQPSWQNGWFQSAWTPQYRGVPDVAYLADPNNGVYVVFQGSWYAFGGTSVGAPQWSGLIALANQMRGSSVSTPNSTIYSLANGNATTAFGGHSISSTYFNDVTSGSDGSAAYDSAFAGYDLVTGVGSPVAADLVPALASGAQTVTTPNFTITASPASHTVTAGNATTYTVTTAGSGGYSGTVNLGVSGLPTGATVSLSAASLAGSGSATLNVATTASTPAGTYTLTITGTDAAGSLTHSATTTLVVTAPVVTATTDTVSAINYTVSGYRYSQLNINLQVSNNLGKGVASAYVAVTLYYNGRALASGAAATGSTGAVTFSLGSAPAGVYNTVVTGVSAAGLTWDGHYPSNSASDPY